MMIIGYWGGKILNLMIVALEVNFWLEQVMNEEYDFSVFEVSNGCLGQNCVGIGCWYDFRKNGFEIQKLE